MKLKRKLLPFESTESNFQFYLLCEAKYEKIEEGSELHISYVLEGPLSRLKFPGQVPKPTRKDGLWKTTCFELFMRIPGEKAYSEWNFSPSLDWNHYEFKSYRTGRKTAEPSIKPILTPRETTGKYELKVVLGPFTETPPHLDLSMTAVLDITDDGCSYWAGLHTEAKPDFHSSFPDRIALS